jgi:hypothetical protein
MPAHRFRDFVATESPTPAVCQPTCGFVACPSAVMAAMGGSMVAWQLQLYQWAYEQARAVVRPSILESRLAPVWN